MLRSCVCTVLLLGAVGALSISASAAPTAPQSPPAVYRGIPVQERGERCHWLRERIREIEERLSYAPPFERPRLERRLFERREEFRATCRRF